MILQKPKEMEKQPLTLFEKEIPEPQEGEVLIQVEVCAICRTDLHIIEGDLPQHRSPVVVEAGDIG